jgi:hypothetical protein
MRESRPAFGWVRSWYVQTGIGAVMLLLIGGAIFVIACELKALRQEVSPLVSQRIIPPYEDVLIQKPPAVPAASADLKDDSEVVGISAGGRHRAFLISRLGTVRSHVVNDLLGDQPVTVTYCSRTECIRVFTGPMGEPLAVAVGGWDNREGREGLILRLGSRLYRQDTGGPAEDGTAAPFPYPTADYERTTWGRWRDAHPDTDVYIGETSPDQVAAHEHDPE